MYVLSMYVLRILLYVVTGHYVLTGTVENRYRITTNNHTVICLDGSGMEWRSRVQSPESRRSGGNPPTVIYLYNILW